MEMRPQGLFGAAAVLVRVAQIAQQVAALYGAALADLPAAGAKMAIQGVQVGLAVVDDDQPALVISGPGVADPAAGDGVDRRAGRAQIVFGGVVLAPVGRLQAPNLELGPRPALAGGQLVQGKEERPLVTFTMRSQLADIGRRLDRAVSRFCPGAA
jgi:hypothetical protein